MDRIRNEYIRRTAQVEVRWSGNKVQEGRLRSFGHCRKEVKQKDHKKGGRGQDRL